MFRHGLRELLEMEGLEVVAEAHTGRVGVELAASHDPDVVVMDLSMPGMSGIDATRALMAMDPGRRVLMLTTSDDERDVLDALLAGACGYVLKDAEPEEIAAGIRAASSGDASISPHVATSLVERVRRHVAHELGADDEPGLTPREEEVLRRLAQGADNTAIALAMHLSPSTVKGHVSEVLQKLGVENRVQAAVWAARRGLV